MVPIQHHGETLVARCYNKMHNLQILRRIFLIINHLAAVTEV